MMRRRRRLPPHLADAASAFDDLLAVVEPAKAELTQVVPTTRLPGRPLQAAIVSFEAALARSEALMPDWRRPEVEEVWAACRAGIEESRRRCASLARFDREPEGFEALIWAVEHLMDPLEPLAEAARRFDDLRVRAR
jgi:hypothetical protein